MRSDHQRCQVRSDTGLELRGHGRLATITGEIDTLVVLGGLGHEEAAANTRLLGQVRRLAAKCRRVASVCTGATVLAAAGLLDGRRATTHWYYADRLAERFPRVCVDAAPIYIRDGAVATSGGVTAAHRPPVRLHLRRVAAPGVRRTIRHPALPIPEGARRPRVSVGSRGGHGAARRAGVDQEWGRRSTIRRIDRVVPGAANVVVGTPSRHLERTLS